MLAVFRRFLYVLKACFVMLCLTVSSAFAITCGNDKFEYNGNCIESKFEITTTSDTDSFQFKMSAAGVFYVDWGDGTVDRYDRTGDTEEKTYPLSGPHTYASAGQRTIRFGGGGVYNATTNPDGVTEYSTTSYTMAIGFNRTHGSSDTNANKIARISGSLGALFPTIGDTTGKDGSSPELLQIQPRFYRTFYYANNLTGSIPKNLFSGVEGQPAAYMFSGTFDGCSGLTGQIPENLFSGISGQPANSMFYSTFYGCSGLTGPIPKNLFGNIHGDAANDAFAYTFYNCTNLGKNPETGESEYYVPATLVAGINNFSSVYFSQGTGLLRTCPAGTVHYLNVVWPTVCIPVEDFVCLAGTHQKNSSAISCSPCANAADCPYPTQFTCPDDGYIGNATHDGCVLSTITYHNMDGATLAEPNPVMYYFDSYYQYIYYKTSSTGNWLNSSTSQMSLNNPTKPNAVFLGWCEDAQLETNCKTNVTISSSTSGPKDYYAKWAPIYTLTYNYMGATTTPTTNYIKYYNTDYYLSMTTNNNSWSDFYKDYNYRSWYYTPTKTGFGFLGYYVCDEEQSDLSDAALLENCGSATTYVSVLYNASGDKWVYAKWAPEYTFTYNDMSATTPGYPSAFNYCNYNGYVYYRYGSNAYSSLSRLDASGTYQTRLDADPAKTDFELAGWCVYNSEQPDATVAATCDYPSAGFVPADLYNNPGDRWAYAKWVVPYTITYNDMGATTSANNVAGYYFRGSNPAYVRYYYPPSTSWTSSQQVYDTSTLYLNKPTKTGYTFNGWCMYNSEQPDATAATNCSNPIQQYLYWYDLYNDQGDKWMYAKWTPINYNISYYFPDGGTQASDQYTTYNADMLPLTLKTPTRDGYTFVGWCDASGNNCLTTIPDNTIGNQTFYAKWTMTNYAITYNTNGGTCSGDCSPTSYTIESSTITLPTPVLDGFAFGGWYDNANFNGNSITTIPSSSTGDKEYWAKWLPIYTIHYNFMDGTSPVSTPHQYYYDSSNSRIYYRDYSGASWTWATGDYISLNSPDYDGYSFDGYYICDDEQSDLSEESLDDNCNINNKLYVYSDNLGDKWLYAKWRRLSTTCPAGEYAVSDGSNVSCARCEPGFYCTGKNQNDGDELIAGEDDGKYACPSDDKDDRPYSSEGAKSKDDCSICPPVDRSVINFVPNEKGSSFWFDLNGDGRQTKNECLAISFSTASKIDDSFSWCLFKAICSDPELAPQVYIDGLDCDGLMALPMMAELSCDWATIGMTYMTCRYNEDTFEETNVYTDCSKPVTICNETDAVNWLGTFELSAFNGNSDLADLFRAELSRKHIQSNSNSSQKFWKNYFNQNIANLLPDEEPEEDIGAQIMGTLVQYNSCAIDCDSDTVLNVLDAPMCMIVGPVPSGEQGLTGNRDGNVYHLKMSKNDTVIHAGSTHRIKIKTGNGTYYLHDASVGE